MADRAAPMSSEEEARKAVFDAIQAWVDAREQVRGFSVMFNTRARNEAKRRGEMQAALDAYRTAIERRVLAQHFGSSGWPHEYVMRSGIHKENCRACKILNAARAAQTQETSG